MSRSLSTWQQYDSEAMASDIADAIGDTFGVEIGETFARHAEPGIGSHAFNVVTPNGWKFLVTVTQVESDDYCAVCQIRGHDQCGDGPANRPYNADCPCCRNTAQALAPSPNHS